MFLSQANRFRFGQKILVRSKAIWFGLEIVLGKIECFYIIQKLIDRNKMFWFGPLIIRTKAKRFDLVRLLSERKQKNLICSKNYLSNTIWRRALLQCILLAVERDTPDPPPIAASLIIPANNIQYWYRKIPAKISQFGHVSFYSTTEAIKYNVPIPGCRSFADPSDKITIYRENPAKCPCLAKNQPKYTKVYHSLYSLIEKLQVALWTFMFIMLGFNNFSLSLFNLPISYLSISNPSLLYDYKCWSAKKIKQNFLSFFLLAGEREIETKAQTFRYRSLLSEKYQNVLIWSAYYRNKSRTFQSVPKLFKIESERFGVF